MSVLYESLLNLVQNVHILRNAKMLISYGSFKNILKCKVLLSLYYLTS